MRSPILHSNSRTFFSSPFPLLAKKRDTKPKKLSLTESPSNSKSDGGFNFEEAEAELMIKKEREKKVFDKQKYLQEVQSAKAKAKAKEIEIHNKNNSNNENRYNNLTTPRLQMSMVVVDKREKKAKKTETGDLDIPTLPPQIRGAEEYKKFMEQMNPKKASSSTTKINTATTMTTATTTTATETGERRGRPKQPQLRSTNKHFFKGDRRILQQALKQKYLSSDPQAVIDKLTKLTPEMEKLLQALGVDLTKINNPELYLQALTNRSICLVPTNREEAERSWLFQRMVQQIPSNHRMIHFGKSIFTTIMTDLVLNGLNSHPDNRISYFMKRASVEDISMLLAIHTSPTSIFFTLQQHLQLFKDSYRVLLLTENDLSNRNMLVEAYYAVVAAVYQDQGAEAAKEFVAKGLYFQQQETYDLFETLCDDDPLTTKTPNKYLVMQELYTGLDYAFRGNTRITSSVVEENGKYKAEFHSSFGPKKLIAVGHGDTSYLAIHAGAVEAIRLFGRPFERMKIKPRPPQSQPQVSSVTTENITTTTTSSVSPASSPSTPLADLLSSLITGTANRNTATATTASSTRNYNGI